LYGLDAGALAGLERMAEKSAANIVAAIDLGIAGTLHHALGIRNVFESTARDLAQAARFASSRK
jgi:DNA ligase (NAD+)